MVRRGSSVQVRCWALRRLLRPANDCRRRTPNGLRLPDRRRRVRRLPCQLRSRCLSRAGRLLRLCSGKRASHPAVQPPFAPGSPGDAIPQCATRRAGHALCPSPAQQAVLVGWIRDDRLDLPCRRQLLRLLLGELELNLSHVRERSVQAAKAEAVDSARHGLLVLIPLTQSDVKPAHPRRPRATPFGILEHRQDVGQRAR